MYESVIETGLGLVAAYGLGVLLVVFALEGALVGKIIPTRALFVGAVLALGSDGIGLASVFLAAVIGATIGQLVLFTIVQRTAIAVESLPGPAESATEGRLQEYFDRWGLPAIAVSNFLPVARGTLTVPAAMADAGTLRFSSAAVVGTAVYAGWLIAFAMGLEFLVSLA